MLSANIVKKLFETFDMHKLHYDWRRAKLHRQAHNNITLDCVYGLDMCCFHRLCVLNLLLGHEN